MSYLKWNQLLCVCASVSVFRPVARITRRRETFLQTNDALTFVPRTFPQNLSNHVHITYLWPDFKDVDGMVVELMLLYGRRKSRCLKAGTHWPNWSVWRDSDEIWNKSVRCVQLRWKLSEPLGSCLIRFNMPILRKGAVGLLSCWIPWLAVC